MEIKQKLKKIRTYLNKILTLQNFFKRKAKKINYPEEQYFEVDELKKLRKQYFLEKTYWKVTNNSKMRNLKYSKIALNFEDDKKFAFGISGKLIAKNHPESSIVKKYWRKYE